MSAHTTGMIARMLGAELVGRDDLPIGGVEGLDRAREGHLTFIRDNAYGAKWGQSKASAAIVTRGVQATGHDPARRALLVVDNADAAMMRLLAAVAPVEARPPAGVHPTAIVDPTARLGRGVAIGPMCIIGEGVTIGDNTALLARVTIGRGVRIGRAGMLHPGVVVHDGCTIGDACVLKSGSVIGAEGFGFFPSPDGRGLVKIPHAGTVIIGDDVEIGVNSCVDRAKMGATTIGSGTKIDNLSQIGHGAQIGRACMICGQTGISGSTVVGDGCVLGGQTGIVDNLTIYPGTKIAAKSGVMQQPEGPGDLLGYPARPARLAARIWIGLDRLPELLARVSALEKQAGVGRNGSSEPRAGAEP